MSLILPKESFFKICVLCQCTPFFYYKQSIFDPCCKNCLSFSKKLSEKLFSNCLVDGILTSVVSIFEHSECCHSLLQGHLQYVMHTFELTKQASKQASK